MSVLERNYGEFVIIEKLGQGAMGAVYKARQTSLNRIVALKLLPVHYTGDSDFLVRFKNEAMAAASLNHPNIVQVYAAGEDHGTHYFAMEYVEGESLGDRLERKGRIAPREAVAIACHLAQSLNYAWKKGRVVHRDIKPDNIFLSDEGIVKLGDLGLVKMLEAKNAGLTRTGAMMGTPYYISPEQALGVKEIDFRADIYSLGCTIYHSLAGAPPYHAESAMGVMMQHISQPAPKIQAMWPSCPLPIVGLLDRMLRKRPDERHESYEALLEQLFWVAERLDGLAATVEAAASLIVPMPAPRFGSSQAASQKPASAEKSPTTLKVAKAAQPRATIGGGRMLAIFGPLAMAVMAVFIWQPWSHKGQAQATIHSNPAMAPNEAVPASTSAKFVTGKTFENTLGMKFNPVPGTKILFSIWDTRVKDYAAFAKANAVNDAWTNQQFEGVRMGRDPDHPVVGVSWDDAQAFCVWLTEKETWTGNLPKGARYRLPTDEEWSLAAGMPREEGATPSERNQRDQVSYPWGHGYPPPTGKGNYADLAWHEMFPQGQWIEGYADGYATTSPVGSFPPNAFGLYDMGGNVWQWCEDWYGKDINGRVLRGTGWNGSGSQNLLLSHRYFFMPDRRNPFDGFRCVLDPRDSAEPAMAKSAAAPPTAGKKNASFENTLGMKFVPVPISGGPTDKQRVLFSIWQTRVQDYEVFATERKVVWWKPQFEQSPAHPAVHVSWDDAVAFCTWLTERERKAGKLGESELYRLPSDHEWSCAVGLGGREDAAKSPEENDGNMDQFPWGDAWPPPPGAGNFGGEELRSHDGRKSAYLTGYRDGFANTSPVGSFRLNAFGIYDLGGNVREWVGDFFKPSGFKRTLRGGAWLYSDKRSLQSAYRCAADPAAHNEIFGFRCVLAPASSRPSASAAGTGVTNADSRSSAGWISLINRIDPAADAVSGQWSRVADEIRGDTLKQQENLRGILQIPYEPPQEYDFRITFTVWQGNGEATQWLSAFGHQFRWVTATGQSNQPNDRWAGFDKVSGKRLRDSAAAVHVDGQLLLNLRHESLVEIRRDRATGYIDGKKIVNWPTDFHEMTNDGPFPLRDSRAIGIEVWWSRTTFHDISVREVTGKGKHLR